MIRRSGVLGGRGGSIWTYSPDMLDGGEDAPMDERSNRFFKHIAIAALVLVAILLVVAVLGR